LLPTATRQHFCLFTAASRNGQQIPTNGNASLREVPHHQSQAPQHAIARSFCTTARITTAQSQIHKVTVEPPFEGMAFDIISKNSSSILLT
jgi:hypothetical protein